MLNPTEAPLVVVVKDGRYDCYGPLTARSRFLMNLLKAMGGVSESVEEGHYHFNMIELDGLEPIVSLTRFEE